MTVEHMSSVREIESHNSLLAKETLEKLLAMGVHEFCLCPGARNAPLVYPLVNHQKLQIYHWSEERSAAFFALGRIKATGKAVAVVTTSGTAVAELFPAVMEAYYSGLPLILLTADRPKRFRGTGAPQAAEQVNLFGCYTHAMYDITELNAWHAENWSRQGPLHLNICFEEPKDSECQHLQLDPTRIGEFVMASPSFIPHQGYEDFLKKTSFPFVIVSGIYAADQEAVVAFLLHLNAPVYLESMSGLREDARLAHLQIKHVEDIWQVSKQHAYPIDGILRIGTVPTVRLWRDLETTQHSIPVFSISHLPFAGLTHGDFSYTSLSLFVQWALSLPISKVYSYERWKGVDQLVYQFLCHLFLEEPLAEPSLVYQLSKKIPKNATIYLGNSLPIREWDLGATYENKHFHMASNRGVNGIDGQLSTFLGYAMGKENSWAILGDLTVLYDLVAPWIETQGISPFPFQLVVINNGGGKIFSRMFAHAAFQNCHQLSFDAFAEMWKWEYVKWQTIPQVLPFCHRNRVVELLPDQKATERFYQKYQKMGK